MKHGHTKGAQQTRTYKVYRAMLQRCQNPKHPKYSSYGGRGIKVCEKWLAFETFLSDMGEAPAGLTLEREDTNGDYEPGNCRCATQTEQQRNRTNNRVVQVAGKSVCLMQACEEAGLPYQTVWARLKYGWSIERALETPVRGSCS